MLTDTITQIYGREVEADVDELIELAIDRAGVLRLTHRIGAVPYFKYTPYRNNRGVIVDNWSCMSMKFVGLPGKTIRSEPTIVRPADTDMPWRHLSTPAVRSVCRRSRAVSLCAPTTTPFAGRCFEYNLEQ